MENKNFPTWLLAIFSWVAAAYFLISFHLSSGLPPQFPLSASLIFYLLIGLFFMFVPFFNKIKIPKVIELERTVAEAKREIKSFRDQTNNMLSVLSTSINTINSNTTNIIIPDRHDLADTRHELEKHTAGQSNQAIKEIEEQLVLEDEDKIVALARLRIKLEFLLRDLLLHISPDKEKRNNELKRYSLRKMFIEFKENSIGYEHLEKPIDYVTQICNAAIHGQMITPGQADEALELGARILTFLPRANKNETAQQKN